MLRIRTSSMFISYVVVATLLSVASLVWLAVKGVWSSGSVFIDHDHEGGHDLWCWAFWTVEGLLTAALSCEILVSVYLVKDKVRPCSLLSPACSSCQVRGT